MVKLIIHCGDIHIRKFQRLDEYAEQLNRFIERCKEIAEPYERDEVRIVICGDLAHSKLEISNEFIVFASFFIRQLEEIGKVVIIAGNHDLIESNTSRTDTITALFETANFQNSMFLDMMLDYQSGCVVDENITWALYSIYDNYMKPNIEDAKEKNPNNRVIGLYHGMIVGSTMPNGMVVEEGVNGDVFGGCDCVMAAHIHKRQELRRGDVEIVYCGSLIQQTYGETVSQHGFVVWNPNTLDHNYVDVETNYGLYDIEISSIDDIDEDKERLINF